jgi:hypothetical protein
MPNYGHVIVSGKAGTKARIIKQRQEALDTAKRNAMLPLPGPTLITLTPNTSPAGADVTVTIAGNGFKEDDTVNIGVAHSLVPDSITPTEIVVTVRATNVAEAGVLSMSVTDSKGKTGNALDFTVTEGASQDESRRRGNA